MHNRNKLHLLGLLVAVFFMFGCGSGNVVNTGKDATSSTTSSPTPVSTPSTGDKIKEFQTKTEELCDFIVRDQLDPKARIKGKVAMVKIRSSDYACSLDGFNKEKTDFEPKTLEAYGLTKDDMALTTDEVDTLIRQKCMQGKQIGSYTLTGGRSIPAYQLECEISVTDYKGRFVFATKTFVGKELDKDIEVDSSATEVKAYVPSEEIENYIKSLKSK